MSWKRPENPSYPASSFMGTAVDGSSVLSPGVWGCVAGRKGVGGGSFFLRREVGGEERLRQINGDKWSWEWDGPEAKGINNASRHWLRHSAIPHCVFTFTCFCWSWTTWTTAETWGGLFIKTWYMAAGKNGENLSSVVFSGHTCCFILTKRLTEVGPFCHQREGRFSCY